jgi:hypothetical protein
MQCDRNVVLPTACQQLLAHVPHPCLVKQKIHRTMPKYRGLLKLFKCWIPKSASSSRAVSPTPLSPAAPEVAGTDNASLSSDPVSGMCSAPYIQSYQCHASEPLVPWAEWEFQNDFLQKLNEWNQEHSQETLNGVMKKIQARLSRVGTVLESPVGKEILEFIPNNPFPAGNLVKCLLNVLIIGVVINSYFEAFCKLC